MGSEVICELDLLSGKFAWPNELTQQSGTQGYEKETVSTKFSQLN